MELHSAEISAIKKQLEEWITHPDYELESTFGTGSVDATTFFQVAQRLRSKGLRELSQEDRMTIMTPEHIRFTLNSMGIIQQYCRDDTLNGKPFIAMIKDRSAENTQTDLEEYGVRIKTRRELPLANDDPAIKEQLIRWAQQKKAFRLIRRWSFNDTGIRYDLSIVRSTKQSLQRQYIWQRKFSDQDLSTSTYSYEIEVELSRIEDDNVELAFKRLIKGVGEILRGIQKSTILITNSEKKKALDSYKLMVQTDKFLGCSLVTLEQRNFIKEYNENTPNIRKGYNVTDKADGLRCLAYVDKKGELFLIDMTLNVYRTGLKQESCRESIVDGEYVTRNREGKSLQRFLAFDIYYTTDKKDVSQFPFYVKDADCRHNELKKWIEKFNKDNGPTKLLPYLTPKIMLFVSMKDYFFANAGDLTIFKACKHVLETGREYYTDGLILSPNNLPLPGYNKTKELMEPRATFYDQFKWKPAHDNTIDFLVRFEKEANNPKIDKVTIGLVPETDETIRYKTMRLYVGSSQSFNPREVILNDVKPDLKTNRFKYRAVPFFPLEFSDTMASISYGIVQTDPATQEEYVATTQNNEPIQDKSIVEMRYDLSKPRGWRWIPLRIRNDKTERLNRGELMGTLNGEKAANSVWNSIHDPITEYMIKTGSSEPSAREMNATIDAVQERDTIGLKYFERKAPLDDLKIVKGLRAFHNGYIKEVVLYSHTLKEGTKLIDLACGKGSDIRRWNDQKVSFVLGIDYAGDNITNTHDGTYARYIEIQDRNRIKLPPMVFVIGDTSKRILDGSAGATPEESDILRSVFGQKALGRVPSFIDRVAMNELEGGADSMSCMFALHYFFENKTKLDGLLQNIRETVKVGGTFFGCCFDGESVFSFLESVKKGGVKTGMEKDSLLWTIRKEYDMDVLLNDEDCLGLKINVDFISIGSPHDEYLVNFTYFTKRMKENGFDLLNMEELKEVGLENSTNLFSKSYEMAKIAGRNFQMADSVKQFSFLNRWFIFKKKTDVIAEEKKEEEEFIPLIKRSEVKANLTKPKVTLAQLKAKKEAEKKIEEVPLTVEEEIKEEVEEPVIDNEARVIKASNVVAKEEEKLQATLKGSLKGSLKARTIPVEVGEAAPEQKTYAANQVFQFYNLASIDDKLKIKDKGAGRWLAPSAPFPIEDLDEPGVIYPSLEHFIAGMMYKYGTDKPQLGPTIFGREGTIHQEFVGKRTRESLGGTKPISEERDFELINEESTEIKNAIRPATFKKYKAAFNESKYALKKDELLRKAVEQRYTKDARLQKILEAARLAGKYLLFYTPGVTTNELGGKRTADGTIQGDNKLGKLYMEFGGYK